MKYSFIIMALMSAFMTLGCTTPLRGSQSQAFQPEPRPLGRDLVVAGADLIAADKTIEIVDGELNLRQALSQVLMHNPELAVFSWEIRVKEAETLQAGLLPNPELDVGLENLAGSKAYSGTDLSENSIALSQLIRLGGKREKSRRAASLQTELAGWDFEAKRLDILTSTAKAFFSVLVKQMRVEQADELFELTEHFYRTVSDRVEAGASSPVTQIRAQVTLAAALIAQEQAQLALESARKELAVLWGAGNATFSRVVGSVEQIDPVPPQEQLVAFLDQNPDIARWETEEKFRNAQLSLEHANAIPDLTLSAGFRNFQETDDEAFIFGISIPLPFFDRNQGGIAAAGAAKNKSRYERVLARNQAFSRLAASYRNLNGAFLAATALQEKILPAAGQAFESVDLGYREGKFSFLEVLDAQRTLFEVKGQYIETLAAYHEAKAEVERLIGSSLQAVSRNYREEK